MNSTLTTEDNKIKLDFTDRCQCVRIHVNGIMVYEVQRKNIRKIELEMVC